jgi:predicted DNA-binding transcriptional regulator AlpA
MHSITRSILQSLASSDLSLSTAEQLALSRLIEGKFNEPQVGARNSEDPILVSQAQAAKLLGVSRVTVWRMAKEGMLHPVEILPGSFRYAFEEIATLAQDGVRKKPAPPLMAALPVADAC